MNLQIIMQLKAFTLLSRMGFCKTNGNEMENITSKLTLFLCLLLDFFPRVGSAHLSSKYILGQSLGEPKWAGKGFQQLFPRHLTCSS